MTAWDRLSAELDAWSAAGLTAEFWWRDDDAVDTTAALNRLFALRRELKIPLALAVIPAGARTALADAVRGEPGVEILQHGYAHANHRPEDKKKAELGADRDLWDIARELADGRGRMIDLFGIDGWLEVMVPPWNRIDPGVINLLPGLGFHGLTTFNARQSAEAAPDLRLINTHIDIVDWPGTRAFAGDEAVIGAAIAHLSAKRTDAADPAEPTGLLSHHLAHDDSCWAFIERLGHATAAHPAAVWHRASDMFGRPS